MRSWNAGAERIKGYSADQIIGRPLSIFYTEQDCAIGLPRRTLDSAGSAGQYEGEGWCVRADGTRIWVTIVIHAVRDGDTLIGFAKIARDRTEQKRQTEAAEAMAGNMALALSLMSCGACLLDRDGTVVLSNPAFLDIVPSALAGSHLLDAIMTQSKASTRLAARARAAQDEGWMVTLEYVTGERRARQEVLHKAYHDALTGLANRDSLNAQLRPGLDACAATGGCAVLSLDLDRFETVNDAFGHHAGDLVLAEAARRMFGAVRPGDLICRLGGDEFVVVPTWPITAQDA